MSATAMGPAGAAGSIRRSVGTCREAAARFDPYDLAAVLVFGVLFVLVACTFREYAISNDEEVQQRYGEMVVAYYASGFADQALFHFRDLYLYGGLFDVIAVGFQKLLPLDPYAVRHLLTALTGIGGIAAVWATARTIAGPRAGFLAASALAVCGTWYGPMFNHTKDIPFAAAMMGATYLLVRIGRELPRPRWNLIALFGVLCGCALGIRVLGLFLIAYAALVIAMGVPVGRGGPRQALSFIGRSALYFSPAFVLAYAIMLAAWPWSALAPLNPLRGLLAFVDLNAPIQTVLSGRVYHMGDVPRWYVPTYVAIKLSLWMLAGAGLALVFAVLPQGAEQAANKAWRKEIAVIAFAALFPILCQFVVAGPADTGMRHFLFTVPPIAVLAGIGLNGVIGRLAVVGRLAAAGALALVLAGFGDDAATLYRLHPDEYLFFNPLVGGLSGASRRYATDYWVNIMPEAVANLEHFLDRTESVSSVARPRHRYMVLVCGERLPFEKAADARLQWTRDRSRAEFFIAPTHMNCDRYVDGKVIATIKRLGVVIGVIKDRRALVRPNVAGLN
jgi:hypothetical protein